MSDLRQKLIRIAYKAGPGEIRNQLLNVLKTGALDAKTLAILFAKIGKDLMVESKELVRQAEKLERAVQVRGGGRRPGAEATPPWNIIQDANRSIQTRARLLQDAVDKFEKIYVAMD